jgi:hypothetical protein
MFMKGMFEWKILAAIFAVLIVASSALVGNSGIRDMFMNSTGNLGDWLGQSPFGSLFSTPQKGTSAVVITVIAERISLEMEHPVNITVGDSAISEFKGTVVFDFASNSSHFSPSDTSLSLDMPLQETEIRGVSISRLVLESVGFTVSSDKTNITADNDRIEILDFSGDIRVTDSVQFAGNVTAARNGKWSIG